MIKTKDMNEGKKGERWEEGRRKTVHILL